MDTVTDSADMRVADADRSTAQRLLGEHLTAGRLASDEYGERATQAASARTRGEVTALFRDLPQPWPQFDVTAPSGAGEASPSHRARASTATNAATNRLGARLHVRYAAIAITAPCTISGVVLGVVWITYHPIWLLLVGPVVGSVAAILYGILVLVGKRNHTSQ